MGWGTEREEEYIIFVVVVAHYTSFSRVGTQLQQEKEKGEGACCGY